MLKGLAASPGIGIGRAALITGQPPPVPRLRAGADTRSELARFRQAADAFCARLEALAALTASHIGDHEAKTLPAQATVVCDEAKILSAQAAVMRDDEIHRHVAALLESGEHSAEQAVSAAFGTIIQSFEKMNDKLMRTRAADFRDIMRRLLFILTETEEMLPVLSPGSILVADELLPSMAAALLSAGAAGVVTQQGSAFSHLAILARAFGVPAVLSAAGIVEQTGEGDKLIVDGSTGEVLVRPTVEEVSRYGSREAQRIEAVRAMKKARDCPAVTRDGRRLTLTAELSELHRVPELLERGADGVGLLHIEMLCRQGTPLAEHQLFVAYRAVLRALRGRAATIALLDDTREAYLECPVPGDVTPDALLRMQLCALLRAGADGPLRVAFPAVVEPGGFQRMRALLGRCKHHLEAHGVGHSDKNLQLGVLARLPATVPLLPALVREADFILFDSALAFAPVAAESASAAPPGPDWCRPQALALLWRTLISAHEAGIPVGVCGQCADDPMLVPFLVGSGVDELCVAPAGLLRTRAQLGNLCYEYWRERVPEILALPNAEAVVAYIKENWAERTEKERKEPPDISSPMPARQDFPAELF